MPKPLRESITLLKMKRWWIKTAAEQLSCWISWSSYSQLFISFYHSFFHSLSLIAGDLDKNLAARWNILIWKASKKDGAPLATELLGFFQLPGNTDAIHCNPSSISQVSRPVLCKDGKHFRSWSSTQRVLSTQIAHVFVPSRYYTNMFIIHIYISCIMYHMPIDYTIFISSVRRVMPCERRMKNAKPSLHISWSTAGLGSQNTAYLVVYSWSKEVKSLSVYTELDVYIYNNWM